MPWNSAAKLPGILAAQLPGAPRSCVLWQESKSEVRTLVQHSSLDAATHVLV